MRGSFSTVSKPISAAACVAKFYQINSFAKFENSLKNPKRFKPKKVLVLSINFIFFHSLITPPARTTPRHRPPPPSPRRRRRRQPASIPPRCPDRSCSRFFTHLLQLILRVSVAVLREELSLPKGFSHIPNCATDSSKSCTICARPKDAVFPSALFCNLCDRKTPPLHHVL